MNSNKIVLIFFQIKIHNRIQIKTTINKFSNNKLINRIFSNKILDKKKTPFYHLNKYNHKFKIIKM